MELETPNTRTTRDPIGTPSTNSLTTDQNRQDICSGFLASTNSQAPAGFSSAICDRALLQPGIRAGPGGKDETPPKEPCEKAEPAGCYRLRNTSSASKTSEAAPDSARAAPRPRRSATTGTEGPLSHERRPAPRPLHSGAHRGPHRSPHRGPHQSPQSLGPSHSHSICHRSSLENTRLHPTGREAEEDNAHWAKLVRK